jgi:4-amino-4-deoxy-L-arabinose transferase-like glycosyltransferase
MERLKDRFLYVFYSMLLFVPVILFRDFRAGNELKYLSISNEMLNNNHIFILKNHGELYGDKPPLYLWFIGIIKSITGEYNYLIIFFLTFIPSLVIVHILNKWTKDILDKNERFIASLLLISTGLYAGATAIIRMDMMMSMFITAALYTFYRVYSGKAKYKFEAYLIYIFIFLAIFTKGPMGIVVPLLSIVLYMLMDVNAGGFKNIKLKWGMFIIFFLMFFWIYMVYREGGSAYIYNLFYKQTAGRSLDSFAHAKPVYYYLKNIAVIFAPWPLFYIYGIINSLINFRKLKDMERFFLIVILSTFIFLSFVSCKLEIYLLPLCAFCPFLSLMRLKESLNKKKIVLITFLPSVLILTIAFAAAPFAFKNYIGQNPRADIFVIIAFLLGLVSLAYMVFGNYIRSTKAIFLGMTLFIWFVVSNIKEINKITGLTYVSDVIREEADGDKYEVYSYMEEDFLNMDVILEQDIKMLGSKKEFENLIEADNMEDIFIVAKNKKLKGAFTNYIFYKNNMYTILEINKTEKNAENI